MTSYTRQEAYDLTARQAHLYKQGVGGFTDDLPFKVEERTINDAEHLDAWPWLVSNDAAMGEEDWCHDFEEMCETVLSYIKAGRPFNVYHFTFDDSIQD